MPGIEKAKTAVLVLGCPQVPVQTGVGLYLMHALRKKGVVPVVAGNRAARMLIEVADPEQHYVGETVDLDRFIEDLAGSARLYDLYFVFIHNDSGVSYAATVQSITGSTVVALIYGERFQEIADSVDFPCEKIAVNAVHNPMPLKKKIDEVLPWVVSNL